MSNLYVTEPAPTGKVIVETTMGDIEIELWCKETPKACRNFLALCMEGYYDNIIFHRIVSGFLVQTGDPTGTGMGGDSFYGEPFENETHSRLKFNRRGLVAFANNGDKCSNGSQWLITLDRTDELQGKHTLFGRVNGPTIFNVLKIAALETNPQTEAPLFPPKITSTRIIENPFTDFIPRITREERKAQEEARRERGRERERGERRRGGTKNTGLLSFGDEEDQDSGKILGVKKKNLARPDFVDPSAEASTSSSSKSKSAQNYVDMPASLKGLGQGGGEAKKVVRRKSEREEEDEDEDEDEDVSTIRAKAESSKKNSAEARKAEIAEMQAKIRKLDKRRQDDSSDESDDDAPRKKRSGPSFLEQELAKYSTGRRGKKKSGKKDEDDVMSALTSFTSKIKKAAAVGGDEDDDMDEEAREQRAREEQAEAAKADDDTGGLEVDDDVGFMSHALKALRDDNAEQTRRAEADYAVIDPRAKARELKDEKRERNSDRRRRH